MGWTDVLKGTLNGIGSDQYNKGKSFISSDRQAQIADPLNLLGMSGTPNVPGIQGVGGPAADPSLLRQTPDGKFYDPTTGTTYLDQSGQQPIAAQNVSQQVASATGNSSNFLGRNAVQDQRSAAAYNGQKAFEGDLNQVIRNPNAPTVSTSVMNQALGNIDRQQLAGVAGEGGANAGAARKQALVNMGNLDLQAAGQGAVARATEANGARQALGNTLQQEAGNANDATGQNNAAAGAFANLGMQGATANQNAQNAINASNQENANKNKNGIAGAFGGIAGGLEKLL